MAQTGMTDHSNQYDSRLAGLKLVWLMAQTVVTQIVRPEMVVLIATWFRPV